jgi:hypothetical protein
VNESSFLKEIGRSYIVSSFLPAALFVSVVGILFRGFVPSVIFSALTDNTCLLGNGWIWALIITSWIAFYLYSSVDWTVKLFEGYFLPEVLQSRLKDLFYVLRFVPFSKKYREFVRLATKKKLSARDQRSIPDLRMHALAELQPLEIQNPLDKAHLMPTRLGNVLRASEIYAYERYHIEGITIWPRLFHVLPRQFVASLEEKNNHLLFLLHSSLLAYFNAGICILAGITGLVYQRLAGIRFDLIPTEERNFFIRGFNSIKPTEYLVIGVLAFCLAYMMYSVAVNAAEGYALFVRAGFDLYRMDLLKELRQPMPKELQDEKQLWMVLHEYFVAANRLGMRGKEINFPYTHYENKTTPENEGVAISKDK